MACLPLETHLCSASISHDLLTFGLSCIPFFSILIVISCIVNQDFICFFSMKDHQAQMTIPHLFMCPISLDLFTDPVTLCTGQTYDRSSIEKWLAAGNLTCPVTMQKLHDPSLVPNHTLRHLVHQWRLTSPQFHPNYFTTEDCLAALQRNLESHKASLDTKVQLLEALGVLIEGSLSTSSCMIQLGFVPLLLKMAFGRVETEHSEDNVKLIEQALFCALRLLPLGEKGSLNMLKEEAKLASFPLLFRHSATTNKIKVSLCCLIVAISSYPETRQLCAMLGETDELLHEMVLLLQQNSEASNDVVMAISALCSLQTNREGLVKEGAIDGLIAYISNAEKKGKSLAPVAVATLEQLMGVEGAKETLISNRDGIRAIVKTVFKVSDHEGSESSVKALMMVCCVSVEAREEAISVGVLTQLLLLLQSQCDGRIKTNARMLLKLLKSKWAEDTKHMHMSDSSGV